MMLRKTLALVLVIFLSQPVFGAILFEDDFEEGNLDKWENTVPQMQVIEDPDNADNMVLEQNIEVEGPPLPIPAGSLDAGWTDYIWEFDWWWIEDAWVGTGYRYQDGTHYFHSSRRAGNSFSIFMWDGNFAELVNVPWNTTVGTWYRMQHSIIGAEHIVKGKERDDDTPFDELPPLVTLEDDTYTEGPIGLFGASELMYWDNIIVYEPGTDLSGAVEPGGKLAVTWGEIKF